MDAKVRHIEKIRLWAVETLQMQRTASKEGTADRNRKIMALLESCQEIGAAPPDEWLAVIARQLDTEGRSRNAPRLKIKQMAASLALAHEPTISDKKLARLCGVSRPTVARWKKDPSFQRLKAIFEMDSVLKEALPSQQKPSR